MEPEALDQGLAVVTPDHRPFVGHSVPVTSCLRALRQKPGDSYINTLNP